LGPAERLPLELIGEEYRVRRCAGETPNPDDYLRRFGDSGGRLRSLLAQIDAEVAREANGAALPIPSATPVASISIPELLDVIRRHSLVAPARLEAVLAPQGTAAFADVHALARRLLEEGCLTAYQVNLLLQGRGAELVLGAYVLLGRLGSGRCSQVFKA